MSDLLVDAVADLVISDAATFASLPLALVCRIFLALPAVTRGRASCVCRAWRDALADPALWTRLNLSVVHVEQERFDAVLRGAAGRACSKLCHLELSQHDVTWDVLLPVLTANAGSLRELSLRMVDVNDDGPTVAAVLAAAPLLQVLTVEDARCWWQDAPRMLRAEPPFATLQLRDRLEVYFDDDDDALVHGGMERVGPFAAALADAALQPELLRVQLCCADTAQPALMGALVDAAVARRLRALRLAYCTAPAAALLARLLTEGSLDALEVCDAYADDAPLFDAAGAALVAGALRLNTTLTLLTLFGAELWVDVGVACTLLGALTGHPSLCKIQIACDELDVEDCSALGAALAALIAADAPALQLLNCSSNRLGDVGLAPIVEVLALNRHLRELDVGYNGMSEAFVLERLLPAVRANTTLCELKCASRDSEPAAAAEAEELVRRRGQHA